MTTVEKDGQRAEVKPGRDIVASMADELRQTLKEVVSVGIKELVINLSGVTMIDSVGIGLLIAAHNSLNKEGGKLVIKNASKEIDELFKSMRLNQRFSVSGA